MSPELQQAVKERVELDHSKEEITAELREAGYDDETISAVYQNVMDDTESIEIEQQSDSISSNNDLIGYQALVSESFTMAKNQIGLLFTSALYIVGVFLLVVGLLLASASLLTTYPAAMFGANFIIGVFGIIGFLVLTFALQRGLLFRSEQISYLEHVKAMSPHVLGIILVSLYVQFAVSLGYLLLVLPGIALSVYLMYTIIVRIVGPETGVMTLVRSTELVYNRWWSVFFRLIFVSLTFILYMIPLFLVVILVWGGVNFANSAASFGSLGSGTSLMNDMIIPFIFGLLFFLAIVAVSFLIQCAMIILYESLRDTAQPFTEKGEGKLYFWMKVIVVLGIPATIFSSYIDIRMSGNDMTDIRSILQPSSTFQVESSQDQAASQAELEAFMQEFEAEFDKN